MRERYHRRRAELMERLGGRCSECGSPDNLQFDHKDYTKKSFGISPLLAGASQEKLEKEIPKLQLLCYDCHLAKTREEGSLGRNARRGEGCNLSKLTKNEVIRIRELANQHTRRELAIMFNTSQHNIGLIIRRKTWKHI